LIHPPLHPQPYQSKSSQPPTNSNIILIKLNRIKVIIQKVGPEQLKVVGLTGQRAHDYPNKIINL
jgi:hypothetical protein